MSELPGQTGAVDPIDLSREGASQIDPAWAAYTIDKVQREGTPIEIAKAEPPPPKQPTMSAEDIRKHDPALGDYIESDPTHARLVAGHEKEIVATRSPVKMYEYQMEQASVERELQDLQYKLYSDGDLNAGDTTRALQLVNRQRELSSVELDAPYGSEFAAKSAAFVTGKAPGMAADAAVKWAQLSALGYALLPVGGAVGGFLVGGPPGAAVGFGWGLGSATTFATTVAPGAAMMGDMAEKSAIQTNFNVWLDSKQQSVPFDREAARSSARVNGMINFVIGAVPVGVGVAIAKKALAPVVQKNLAGVVSSMLTDTGKSSAALGGMAFASTYSAAITETVAIGKQNGLTDDQIADSVIEKLTSSDLLIQAGEAAKEGIELGPAMHATTFAAFKAAGMSMRGIKRLSNMSLARAQRAEAVALSTSDYVGGIMRTVDNVTANMSPDAVEYHFNKIRGDETGRTHFFIDRESFDKIALENGYKDGRSLWAELHRGQENTPGYQSYDAHVEFNKQTPLVVSLGKVTRLAKVVKGVDKYSDLFMGEADGISLNDIQAAETALGRKTLEEKSSVAQEPARTAGTNVGKLKKGKEAKGEFEIQDEQSFLEQDAQIAAQEAAELELSKADTSKAVGTTVRGQMPAEEIAAAKSNPEILRTVDRRAATQRIEAAKNAKLVALEKSAEELRKTDPATAAEEEAANDVANIIAVDDTPQFDGAEILVNKLGMTEKQANEFSQRNADRRNKAVEVVVEKKARDKMRADMSLWRKKYDIELEAANRELLEDPINRWAGGEKNPDPEKSDWFTDVKLDKDDLKNYTGDTKGIPKNLLGTAADGAVPIHELAAALGTNPLTLIRTLRGFRPIAIRAREMAHDRTVANHGRPMSDSDALLAAKADSDAGKYVAEQIREELDALLASRGDVKASVGFATKAPRQTEDIARDAEASIADTTIEELTGMGNAALKSAKKNAAQSVAAVMSGDIDIAIYHKTQQAEAHAQAVAHANAKRDAAKLTTLVDRLSDNKRVVKTAANAETGSAMADIDNAIGGIVEMSGGKSVGRNPMNVAGVVEWVGRLKEETGISVNVPTELLDNQATGSIPKMSVKYARAVLELLQQLNHIASTQNKLLVARTGQTYQEVKDGVLEAIGTVDKETPKNLLNPDGTTALDNVLTALRDLPGDAASVLVFPEILIKHLGGGGAMNRLWRALVEPFADSATNRSKLLMPKRSELSSLIDKTIGKKAQKTWHDANSEKNGAMYIDGIGATSLEQRLSAALNSTNEYNMRAYMDSFGIDRVTLQRILDSLTPEQIKFVNGVTKMWESLKEQSFAVDRQVLGVNPRPVTGKPVRTKNGTIDGGYYPLAIDYKKSSMREPGEGEILSVGQTISGKSGAFTDRSHLEARRGIRKGTVLRQDLAVIEENLQQVVHDITHRRAAIDAYRLLTDKDVSAAIIAKGGRNVYDALVQWTKRVAGSGDKPPPGRLQRWARKTRIGLTLKSLSASVSTALKQAGGIPVAANYIGWKALADGYSHVYARGPIHARDLMESITKLSPAMAERWSGGFDRDVAELTYKAKLIDPKGGAFVNIKYAEAVAKFGMKYFVGWAQKLVDSGIWIGAYRKALGGGVDGIKALDANMAIKYADQTVRLSQGDGNAFARSLVQSSNDEFVRSFARFFTPRGAALSTMYDIKKTAQEASWGAGDPTLAKHAKTAGKDALNVVSGIAAFWILPTIIEALISGKLTDDPKEAAIDAALYPAAQLPGVSDIITGVKWRRGKNIDVDIPITDVIENTADLGIGVHEAVTKHKYRNLVKAGTGWVGTFTGLPTAQAWKSGNFINDSMDGVAKTDSAYEWFIRFLITGTDQADAKNRGKKKKTGRKRRVASRRRRQD